MVPAKLRAVLRNGMTPVCCVGETEDERDGGMTEDRLTAQVTAALAGLPAEAVAGTGGRLRARLGHRHRAGGHARRRPGGLRLDPRCGGRAWPGDEAADGVRIQYGGSVTAENTGRCSGAPTSTGPWWAGPAWRRPQFVGIVRAAAQAVR